MAEDSIGAEELLVARGGDEGWLSAAETLDAHPELAPPEPAAPEPEPEEQSWELLAEEQEPSEAAEEVLGEASVATDTGRRRPEPATAAGGAQLGPGAMPREHGLGQWIGQAWEMVTGDLANFALGMLLAGVVTVVTIGICGPPLQAGLYIMALKRFRGEEISPGTVFEGFQYFLPAWGVALLTALVSFVLTAPLSVPTIILGQQGENQELLAMLNILSNVWGQIVGLAIAGAVFYAMVLVVERKLGSIDALKGSWEVTKTQLLSYVGMALVLQFIAGAGVLLCCIGLLVTAPMVPCTQVAAYMYHFRNR